jgi:hypothetical protein
LQETRDVVSRDAPRRRVARQSSDELVFERLVAVQRGFFVSAEVEQNGQRELSGAAPGVVG